MTYIPSIRDRPTNKITMTGYQVESYDFSARADREGILDFLDAYRDAEILVNHGDRCEAFAEELREDGFDATAPAVGDDLSV